MKEAYASTARFDIMIAGDYDTARQICRKFCERGLCVTVDRTTYIYKGGEEAGVKVGLIQYPKFQKSTDIIRQIALELAHKLREELCQESFTLVGPEETYWYSLRDY